MADLEKADQKPVRRYLEWAGAALIGAVVTLIVTESYTGLEKRRELAIVEKQIHAEITGNLETIDRMLWRLESLEPDLEHLLARTLEIGKFRSLLNISYHKDVYRRYDEKIDLLNNGAAIRRFFLWLDDSTSLQIVISGRYEHYADDDILLNSAERFEGYIRSLQRQGIYLYLYGCKIIEEFQPLCFEKLNKIQGEFRVLEKTPDPIIDIPLEKLQEFLTGWSEVIDERK